MTKKLHDDELEKISGAGDKAVQTDLDKELVGETGGGPGGPSDANKPTADGDTGGTGNLSEN